MPYTYIFFLSTLSRYNIKTNVIVLINSENILQRTIRNYLKLHKTFYFKYNLNLIVRYT